MSASSAGPTKSTKPERWCESTGKLRHETIADANRALAVAKAGRADERASELHAFHCSACGGIHLGHHGWRDRRFDPDLRRRGPRLSGTARLRRKLGEALVRGNRRRAAAIVKLIQRLDRERRG